MRAQAYSRFDTSYCQRCQDITPVLRSGECRACQKRAWKAVEKALARGILVKPDSCSWCQSSLRILAHHEDYSQPLVVVWICQNCHKEHHRKPLTEQPNHFINPSPIA